MTKMFCPPRRRLSPTRALAAMLAALCLAGATPARALNFQLRHFQMLGDGAMVDHTCFQYDEHTEMVLDLPRGWNTSSTATSVTSSPTDRPTNQIQLEKSALTPDTPFQEKGLETYRQRFLATVPKGAQNVHLVKEEADPLPIFGWKDYEFVVDYDFYGQSFRRSAMYINVNATLQLLMTVTSDRGTFDEMRIASFRVMRSWSVVPKGAGSNPGN